MFPTNEQLEQHLDQQFSQSVQSRARDIDFGMSDVSVPYDNIYNSGLIFNIATVADTIPEWSIYPARRDRAIRAFYKTEPIIAGAVYSVAAKLKSLDWKLTGEEDLQENTWAMLNSADLGNGMSALLNNCMIDYCTQDNGFFVEKIGAGSPDTPLTTEVTGILHLDAAQCWRTFDPEYPVMYVDPVNGTRHRMHRTRVVSRSSMTQPNELARGVGYSPVSRALLSVKTMKSIMEYRYEKASGSFQRGIIFGKGLTNKTLESLMQGNQLNAESEGLTRITNMPAYVTINGVELQILDLASIPDNWDTMNEYQLYAYIIALAFGVDVREFWSVQQSGATKGDATVQHMKAKGKGFADMLTTIEEMFNNDILPDGMTIEADFIDDEHDRGKADKDSVVVNTLSKIKQDGVIDAIEERALLIDANVLDPDVLEGARKMPGMAQFISDFEQRQADMQESLQGNNQDENANGKPNNLFDDNQSSAPKDETQAENGNIAQKSFTTVNGYALVDNIRYHPTVKAVDYNGDYFGMKDRAGYGASIRAIARGYWYEGISFFDTVDAFDGSIARHYTQAWREGFATAGILPDEISVEDRSTLVSLIQNEKQYVIAFIEWVNSWKQAGNGFQAVLDRLVMWESRYDMIKSKAMLLAQGNKKLKWNITEGKESCVDCCRLAGRVYFARMWEKYNIQPQSSELACFGGYCECYFTETSDPVTKGRPPKLVGHKGINEIGIAAYDKLMTAIKSGTYSDTLLYETQVIIEANLL